MLSTAGIKSPGKEIKLIGAWQTVPPLPPLAPCGPVAPVSPLGPAGPEIDGGAIDVIAGAGQKPKTFKVLASIGFPVIESAT